MGNKNKVSNNLRLFARAALYWLVSYPRQLLAAAVCM